MVYIACKRYNSYTIFVDHVLTTIPEIGHNLTTFFGDYLNTLAKYPTR